MAFLDEQLRLQREAFGLDPGSMRGEDRAVYVRDNVLAATDELHEALHHIGWKPWQKDTPWHGGMERQKYVKELVDVYHFIGNLLLVAEVTDEELEEKYREKVGINTARQADISVIREAKHDSVS